MGSAILFKTTALLQFKTVERLCWLLCSNVRVCLRRECLGAEWPKHWGGTLQIWLAGKCLAGMDKPSSPLIPQHLKPAKEAVLPDQSLPTGKGEIARADCTVKLVIYPLSGLAFHRSKEPWPASHQAFCMGIQTGPGRGSHVSWGLCSCHLAQGLCCTLHQAFISSSTAQRF